MRKHDLIPDDETYNSLTNSKQSAGTSTGKMTRSRKNSTGENVEREVQFQQQLVDITFSANMTTIHGA